nr:hypothetical protein Q903MT_gene2948 [Picea sitchensis]
MFVKPWVCSQRNNLTISSCSLQVSLEPSRFIYKLIFPLFPVPFPMALYAPFVSLL